MLVCRSCRTEAVLIVKVERVIRGRVDGLSDHVSSRYSVYSSKCFNHTIIDIKCPRCLITKALPQSAADIETAKDGTISIDDIFMPDHIYYSFEWVPRSQEGVENSTNTSQGKVEVKENVPSCGHSEEDRARNYTSFKVWCASCTSFVPVGKVNRSLGYYPNLCYPEGSSIYNFPRKGSLQLLPHPEEEKV